MLAGADVHLAITTYAVTTSTCSTTLQSRVPTLDQLLSDVAHLYGMLRQSCWRSPRRRWQRRLRTVPWSMPRHATTTRLATCVLWISTVDISGLRPANELIGFLCPTNDLHFLQYANAIYRLSLKYTNRITFPADAVGNKWELRPGVPVDKPFAGLSWSSCAITCWTKIVLWGSLVLIARASSSFSTFLILLHSAALTWPACDQPQHRPCHMYVCNNRPHISTRARCEHVQSAVLGNQGMAPDCKPALLLMGDVSDMHFKHYARLLKSSWWPKWGTQHDEVIRCINCIYWISNFTT